MLSGSRPSGAEAPKPRDSASDAISGMSWDKAVEAEEIMNKLRLLVDNSQQVEFLVISPWVSGCFDVLVLIYSEFDFNEVFFVPRNEKCLILIHGFSQYLQTSFSLFILYRHFFLFWYEYESLFALSNYCSV